MLTAPDLDRRQLESLLGRTSPVVKLGLALAWLIGLATTLRAGPPIGLALVALAAGRWLGNVPPRRLGRGLAPLAVAALSIALANLLFSGSNSSPAATEIARLGPLRITQEAAMAALALGARVMAIVSVGAIFAQTTDPTRLVDSLVQQVRISPRFAYGALAAYQAVPRLAEDLATLRQARRIRGLASTWHPRLLVGLLVRAIRHADQLALAMDARAFDSGPRSTFRPIRWTWRDLAVGAGGRVILGVALR
ncbi:MAG: energy-coupling factor transporter transmembrane protein EcfT [Chloroflexi bacterium]|nr:energy-coupling factor transporter transmembrane protein EcfT [Chloroflexota bacterium]